MRWKLVLEYDGTAFDGWQVQPGGARTVQAVLEAAIETVFQERCRVHPSGRTDAGVHALGQVVVFDAARERAPRAVRDGLNALLPPDVAVCAAEPVADDFDPRRWTRLKRYRYRWLDRGAPSPLRRHRVRTLRGPLDADAMHRAAQALVGRHDFSAFRAVGCASTHAVRTVLAMDVARVGDEVHLDVLGNGFLRHMVRIVAGTLEQVGLGRRDASWPAVVLAARDRAAAGPTAPACGLYLVSVEYGDGPPAWHGQEPPEDEADP